MSDETWEADRTEAAQWAKVMLDQKALILDTETTGLGGDAEIVQIAIIDCDGHTILESLVKPVGAIPDTAIRIHGITPERVAVAPRWADLWPVVRAIVQGRTVVVFNASYDRELLLQSCLVANIDMWSQDMSLLANWHCAMLAYSAFVGSWNDYYGNYRWQRLPGGDHSALGDCKATLAVLKKMAASLEAQKDETIHGQTTV